MEDLVNGITIELISINANRNDIDFGVKSPNIATREPCSIPFFFK